MSRIGERSGGGVPGGGGGRSEATAARRSPRPWVRRSGGDRRTRVRLRLDEEEGIVLLDDRRIPGTGDTISCIAISPAGVFVIDTKDYKGFVHTKRLGPMSDLGPYELYVGRRNCTRSLERVIAGRGVVGEVLRSTAWGANVPIQPMLCLTRAEWGVASAMEVGEVWVGWPKLLGSRIRSQVVMDSSTIEEVSGLIAGELPASRA